MVQVPEVLFDCTRAEPTTSVGAEACYLIELEELLLGSTKRCCQEELRKCSYEIMM